MSFQEQWGYTADPLFRQRIHVASMTAALNVQGEDKGTIKGGEYDKRQALATKMIQTGGIGTPTEDLQRMFLWAVITNPVITPASDDGELQFVVNSVWSKCAGAKGNEV